MNTPTLADTLRESIRRTLRDQPKLSPSDAVILDAIQHELSQNCVSFQLHIEDSVTTVRCNAVRHKLVHTGDVHG